jgi:NAD(P)-dependent dehydrogenase (short-subunit alcohol dehydrogenase family)
MDNKQYRSTSGSLLGAIKQRFGKEKRIGTLTEGERMDGKCVLITGASSGLGYATAVQLARRGGRVIMAVRSGIPEKGEAVKRESGSSAVEMRQVDLSDLAGIRNLAQALRDDGVKLDRLVLNAATVPAHSRQTKQGLEEMFVVNYLSSFYLANLLIQYGVIKKNADARIIFVASETHRSAPAIDWEKFGVYEKYGMKRAVPLYGYYKHMLLSFAWELSRRMQAEGTGVAVHALCPGPVNSRLAREAPWFVKWLVAAMFALFFKAPARACEPVFYLACAHSLQERTGVYLHLMEEKAIQAETADPENARKLCEASRRLLEKLGHGLLERAVASILR